MPSYFCLSVTFLDPQFHGRRDGDRPEWPPSPLRLYQALVAASAARWGERHRVSYAVSALKWLAHQGPPTIVAPVSNEGARYRLSVPNNAMDIVARAWVRGNYSNEGDANPATHRAMKPVQPTRLLDGETVSYLWALPDSVPEDVRGHTEVLSAAARSLVALGWGIDLVAGYGRVISKQEAEQLPGERWWPSRDGGDRLRVPVLGTLEALMTRHASFLGRLGAAGLTPMPPLSAFAVVGYRRETDPVARPVAAFEIWKPVNELAELPAGRSKFRPFDPARRTAVVAGMVRHAVAEAAALSRPGDKKWRDTFVLGHRPPA